MRVNTTRVLCERVRRALAGRRRQRARQRRARSSRSCMGVFDVMTLAEQFEWSRLKRSVWPWRR